MDDIEPPDLILKFFSEQPTTVQTGLYSQIAFMLSFLLPEESRDRLMGASHEVGEETVAFFLEQSGVGLVGATVSLVSLIDFTLARNVKAHEEIMPETAEALTDQFGNLEFQWRQMRAAHEKWIELRNGLLSPEKIEGFSYRATAVSEPSPINVQGTTQK
jgi:hypothetical protein